MAKGLRLRCVTAASLLISAAAFGAEYYVSPVGNDANPGTKDAPWKTLGYAVGTSPTGPGDTIFVSPGIYDGPVQFSKSGLPDKPLKMASTEWGKAVVRGGIDMSGSDDWLEGFDVRPSGKGPAGGLRFALIQVNGARNKIINCLVHDHGFDVPPEARGQLGACGMLIDADDTEVYGNIMFNNGFKRPDRNTGYSIYLDKGNRTLIENNIIFRDYSTGIHVYTITDGGGDTVIRGNIVFSQRAGAMIQVAAKFPRTVIERNFVFADFEDKSSAGMMVGGKDSGAIEVRDNYVLADFDHKGDTGIGIRRSPTGPRVTGNRVGNFFCYIHLPSSDPQVAALVHLDGNFYIPRLDRKCFYLGTVQHLFTDWQKATGQDQKSNGDWTPGNEVLVVQNKYDPCRFHVAVYRGDPDKPVTITQDSLMAGLADDGKRKVSAIAMAGAKCRIENVRALSAPLTASLSANPQAANAEAPVKVSESVVVEGKFDPDKGIVLSDPKPFGIFNTYLLTITPEDGK